MANYLLNVCRSSAGKFECLQVRLMEKVSVQHGDDTDKVLWETEKFWQTQLFTKSYGLNNANDWYPLIEEVIVNNIFIDLVFSLI